MAAKYDTIGINYAELRKPDPRIAIVIENALGSACTDAYDAGYRLVVANPA